MKIIKRSEWNARSPKAVSNMRNSEGVYIHHSATPAGGSERVRSIQNYHMDSKGWNDIAYSFLVDVKGNIYEGRGWGVSGGHTRNFNTKSHGICFIGDSSRDIVTNEAKVAINFIIDEHAKRYGHGYVRAHRDVAATACPGSSLENWIRSGRPATALPSNVVPLPSVLHESLPRPSLATGSSGAPVVRLQNVLNFFGWNTGRADGIFGSQTRLGVRAMQKDLRVTQDGIYGPVTARALSDWIFSVSGPSGVILREGDRGVAVRGWQSDLANHANQRISVDGVFGPLTADATSNFNFFFNVRDSAGRKAGSYVIKETLDVMNFVKSLRNA
jgi:hypothetical protein